MMSLEDGISPRRSHETFESGSFSSSKGGGLLGSEYGRQFSPAWESRLQPIRPGRRGSNLSEGPVQRLNGAEIVWDETLSDDDEDQIVDNRRPNDGHRGLPSHFATRHLDVLSTSPDAAGGGGLGLEVQPQAIPLPVSATPTLETIPDASPSTIPHLRPISTSPALVIDRHRSTSRNGNRGSVSPYRANFVFDRAPSPLRNHDIARQSTPMRLDLNRSQSVAVPEDQEEEEGLAISTLGRRGRKGSVLASKYAPSESQ